MGELVARLDCESCGQPSRDPVCECCTGERWAFRPEVDNPWALAEAVGVLRDNEASGYPAAA